jgi:hypothetical protein
MEDDDDEEDDPGGGVVETEDERKERERVEKAIEIAAIEAKQVFNGEEMIINFSKKRATDCKDTALNLTRKKKELSTGGWFGRGFTGTLKIHFPMRRESRRAT